MKRIPLLLVLAMSLSFAACQKEETPGPSAGTNSSTPQNVTGSKKPAPMLRRLPSFSKMMEPAVRGGEHQWLDSDKNRPEILPTEAIQ